MDAPRDTSRMTPRWGILHRAAKVALGAAVLGICIAAPTVAQTPPKNDEGAAGIASPRTDSIVPEEADTGGPEPLSGPTATADSAVPREEHATFIDAVHEGISNGLLITAVWLDSFFGDERYEAESNESHFRVSDTILFEDGIWTRYRPDYQLRLVLPQLRRKTRLVISGDIWNDGVGGEDTTNVLPPSSSVPDDREFNTSVQVVLPSHDYHSTTVRGGAKYHSGKIVSYGGPRYRYRRPLGSWTGRITENVMWFSDRGWESKTRFDLERPVPHDLFFRASAEGTWTEGVDGYLHAYTLLLRQPLDSRRAVEYEWINGFHTRPVNELMEVRFVFRYRQQIWRRWLFMEIAPQYRFPRDRGFEATPGIIFKLEMIFKGLRT